MEKSTLQKSCGTLLLKVHMNETFLAPIFILYYFSVSVMLKYIFFVKKIFLIGGRYDCSV